MFFNKSQNLFNIKSFIPQDSSNTLREISTYNNGATKILKWNSLNVITVDLADEYTNNAIVRAVIDRFSTAVCSLEPMIVNTEEHKRDLEHPLNILLRRPNREQVWKELIRDLVNDMFIHDTYYLYAVMNKNNILSLRRILPANVSATSEDTQGNTMTYNVTIGQETISVNNLPYDDKKAVLFKQTFYNPNSDNFKDIGSSPLKAASDAIRHINTANKFNLSFLQNGARPSIAFIVEPKDGYDGMLTDEQREILQEALNSKYSGSENAGRPLLLEGGIKVQNLSTNMKDMDFSNLIELSIQMICIAMGVPTEECGLTNAKTYNSADESRKAFILNTIIPFTDLLYEKLNSFLMPKYDDTGKFKLTYNKSNINLLMKDILDIMVKAKNTEAYTTNEVRDINDMDSVKNGDQVRVGMTTAPLGEAISKNFETTNKSKNSGKKDETENN